MKLVFSTLVLVALLFGGNATVQAAQDDLPNQPLYPIKLMSEDIKFWRASAPEQQIEALMQQSQTRLQEMAALTSKGINPPAALSERSQQRIQRAVQIARNLQDPGQMTGALQQIQAHLRTQEQLMAQISDHECGECEPILQRTREMLRTQLHQVENALVDPGGYQNRERNQIRITQTPYPTDMVTTPQGSCTPMRDGSGQQNGINQMPAATSMPGNNMNSQNHNGQEQPDASGSGGNDPAGKDNDGNGSGPGSGGHGGKP